MFLYLKLNKPNYRKSQLNQSLSTQIQLNTYNYTLNEGKNTHSPSTQVKLHQQRLQEFEVKFCLTRGE